MHTLMQEPRHPFAAGRWLPVTANNGRLDRVNPNTDAHAFFRKDPIAASLDNGSQPTQGFRPASNSVKDCRLTTGDALVIRSKGPMGVTGGHVEYAFHGPIDASWAPSAPTKTKLSQNARKRAQRAAKRA